MELPESRLANGSCILRKACQVCHFLSDFLESILQPQRILPHPRTVDGLDTYATVLFVCSVDRGRGSESIYYYIQTDLINQIKYISLG